MAPVPCGIASISLIALACVELQVVGLTSQNRFVLATATELSTLELNALLYFRSPVETQR